MSSTTESETANPKQTGGYGEKVLIVDDEASIRRILETRFKMLGYETATAEDGEHALETFNRFNPDIVILDIMMPKYYEVRGWDPEGRPTAATKARLDL